MVHVLFVLSVARKVAVPHHLFIYLSLPGSTSSDGFNLYNDSEESQMDSDLHPHANIKKKTVFCSSFWLVVEHNLAYCEHLAESLSNHFLTADHSTKEEMRLCYAVAY